MLIVPCFSQKCNCFFKNAKIILTAPIESATMKAEGFAEMRFLRCTCAAHAGPRSPKTERGGFLKANKADAGGRAQPAPHQVGEKARGRTLGDSPCRSAARGRALGDSPCRSAVRGRALSTPEAAGRLRDAGRCGRRRSAGRCAGRGNPAAGNPGRTRFCRPAALFFIPIFAFTRINNFKSKVYSTLSDAPCPRRHAGRILFEVCCGCTKARPRKHAGRRGEGHGGAERAARVLSAGSPAGRAARGRLRWPDR